MRTDLAPRIFTVADFLSAAECDAMIARAEEAGFSMATITTRNGAIVEPDTRNNDRVMIDDAELAESLWRRIRQEVPALRDGRQARGLNERFRFYRYRPGQKFDWHADGGFARDNGERSYLTFMVYLNEGYSGGETGFDEVSVHGRRGMALVFDHELFHQGAEVTSGMKYVLRSDVMYGRPGQFRG